MNAAVSVRGLVFDYPGKRALHGITIDVPQGAVLALVGPNGAGKSTLMRVIAGLDDPVDGAVVLDGVSVLDHPREVQRHLGYLSDFFGLYDELTVRQCLLHAASIRGVPAARHDEAVRRAVHRVELEDRVGALAGELSRGLRQRLAIAQAVIHDPAVVLLDEPAAGLDPEARGNLSALIRALQSEGRTLVVSSHILSELGEYSTHMLALRDGRVADFRDLGTHPAAGVQRLCIRLAREWQAPAGFWQSQGAGLRSAPEGQSSANHAWVDMGGGADGAARLLRALVEAGAPVAEFAVHRESLQETYLRAARAQDAERA